MLIFICLCIYLFIKREYAFPVDILLTLPAVILEEGN